MESDMKRRAIASALLVCFMLSAASCGKAPEASTIHTGAAFATDNSTHTTAGIIEETYQEVSLSAESGTAYKFIYDSDIFVYTGQGGNFYLVGSDPTKCFLHIVIQDRDGDTFENAKKTFAEKISKEFTLDSGRSAFIYSTDDANNIHVVLDAKGSGLINLYIGAADTWPYSAEQTANMVDKGFAS